MTDKEYKYYAFISYKREDERWAKWLQNKLMHYRIPTSIRKAKSDLPKNVHPVFRDSTDLSGGVLAEAINNALDNSRYLIVICSPRAAQSEWVCKEVQHFIDTGREKYIIPFIVEGTPNSNDVATECFPEALRTLAGSRELLGININEMGRDAAAIKVVARMFGLEFNDLWRRYERYRRRRIELFALIMLLITAIAIGVGVYIANQNSVLTATNRQMQINQARFVSEKAMQLIEEGDSYTAAKIALAVYDKLEDENISIPTELDYVLRQSTKDGCSYLNGHKDIINNVAISNNGKHAASTSEDGMIILWDIETGTILHQLIGHKCTSYAVTFSKDDKHIASSSYDGTIIIWDTENKENIIVKKIVGEPTHGFCLSFSPDGKYLISGSITGDMKMYEVEGNNKDAIRVFAEQKGLITSIIFSPNGKYFASYSYNENIKVWNINNSSSIRTFNYEDTLGLTATAFSLDSNYFFIANKNYIEIWNITSNECLTKLKVCNDQSDIYSIAYSPLGEYIATTSNGTINLWGVENNILVRTRPLMTKRISQTELNGNICFSGDGQSIMYYNDTSIKVWKIKESEVLTLISKVHTDPKISSNSKYVVAGIGKNMLKWDVSKKSDTYETDKVLFDGVSLSFSINYFNIGGYNNGYMVSIDSNNSFKIIDLTTEQTIQTYNEHTDRLLDIAISPNGEYIASASDDNTIKLWSVNNSKSLYTWIEHNDACYDIDFSHTGRYIASASHDGTIRIWDMENDLRESTKTIDEGDKIITSICFSQDDEYIAYSSGHQIKIYSLNKNMVIKTIDCYHSTILCMCFSNDGKYIATGHSGGAINVWYLNSTHNIYSKRGDNSITRIAFGNNGIEYATSNGLVRIWEFKPLQAIADETRERFKDNPLTAEERREYYIE